MALIDTSRQVYFLASQVSAALLLLILPVYILPSNMTGIPQRLRPSVPTISLIMVVIVRGGVTILDQTVSKVGGEMLEILCDVDAMLSLYLGALLMAHLPIVAIYKYTSTPSVTNPSPPRPSKTRNAICIILAHVYALMPLIPSLTIAGSMGFDVPDGFGIWWGYYCRDRAGWIRFLRIVAFSGPLVVALVASFLLFTALIATADHPSASVRPQTRHWAQACFLALCLIASVIYLILEQVQGWDATWWPRCFEGLPAPILLLCLLFDYHIIRAYASWFRFRRPVDEEEGFAIGGGGKYYASSNSLVYSPQKRRPADIAKRSSSFWAPPRDADLVSWEAVFEPPIPRPPAQFQSQQLQKDVEDDRMPAMVDEGQMRVGAARQSPPSPRRRPSTRYPPPSYQAPITKLDSDSPLSQYGPTASTIYSRASSYRESEIGDGRDTRSKRTSDPFRYATSTVYTDRSFPFQLETELKPMPPISGHSSPVRGSPDEAQGPITQLPSYEKSTAKRLSQHSMDGLTAIDEGLASFPSLRLRRTSSPGPPYYHGDGDLPSEASSYTTPSFTSLSRSTSQSHSYETHETCLATPHAPAFNGNELRDPQDRNPGKETLVYPGTTLSSLSQGEEEIITFGGENATGTGDHILMTSASDATSSSLGKKWPSSPSPVKTPSGRWDTESLRINRL
ncbi:hypothetical protein IAR50_004017 [Cryptococcus sp. DSM 104548]